MTEMPTRAINIKILLPGSNEWAVSTGILAGVVVLGGDTSLMAQSLVARGISPKNVREITESGKVIRHPGDKPVSPEGAYRLVDALLVFARRTKLLMEDVFMDGASLALEERRRVMGGGI